MNAQRILQRRFLRATAGLGLIGLALAPARGAGGVPSYTLTRLNPPASAPSGSPAGTERVNAQNQVAGFYFANSQLHAAVWLPDSSGRFGDTATGIALPESVVAVGPTGLTTEQGSASQAVAVGDGGLVVGSVTVPEPTTNNQPQQHACVWVRDNSGNYTGYDVQTVLFAGVSGVFASIILDVHTVNGVPIAIGRSNRQGTDTHYSGWIGAVSINPSSPAQSSTTLADLPPVAGQTSVPLRLNASGDVAGESNSFINGVSIPRATEWRVTVTPPSGGQATQIQVASPIDLQGSLSGNSAARGITDARVAAGFFQAGDGNHHGFRTQPSSIAINGNPVASGGDDLGLLALASGVSLNSYANDVATDDTVGGAAVGSSETAWVSHRGGPLTDLNGAGIVKNPSLYLTGASSVNNSGVIVGSGLDGSNSVGYLLTPAEAPAPTLQDLRLRVSNQSDIHNVTVSSGDTFSLEGVLSGDAATETTVYVQVLKGTTPTPSSTLGLSNVTVLSGNGAGHVVGTAPANNGTTAAVYTIIGSLSPFQAGQTLPADAKQVTLTVRPAGPAPKIIGLRVAPSSVKSGQRFTVRVTLDRPAVGNSTRIVLITNGLPDGIFPAGSILIPDGKPFVDVMGVVNGVFGTIHGTISADFADANPPQPFGQVPLTVKGPPLPPAPKWSLAIKNVDTGHMVLYSRTKPAQIPAGTHLLVIPTLKARVSSDQTFTVTILTGSQTFTTLAPLVVKAGKTTPDTGGAFTAPAVTTNTPFTVRTKLGNVQVEFPIIVTPPPPPLPDVSGAWSALGTHLTVSDPKDKSGVRASVDSMSLNFTSVTPTNPGASREVQVSGDWTLSLHLQDGPITAPGITANLRGTITGTIVADPDHNGLVNLMVTETVPGTAWSGKLVGTLYVDANGFLAIRGTSLTSLTLQAASGKISPFRGPIVITGAWAARGRQITFPEPSLR